MSSLHCHAWLEEIPKFRARYGQPMLRAIEEDGESSNRPSASYPHPIWCSFYALSPCTRRSAPASTIRIFAFWTPDIRFCDAPPPPPPREHPRCCLNRQPGTTCRCTACVAYLDSLKGDALLPRVRTSGAQGEGVVVCTADEESSSSRIIKKQVVMTAAPLIDRIRPRDLNTCGGQHVHIYGANKCLDVRMVHNHTHINVQVPPGYGEHVLRLCRGQTEMVESQPLRYEQLKPQPSHFRSGKLVRRQRRWCPCPQCAGGCAGDPLGLSHLHQ
mmetsp:Transcript_27897/g.61041  ORF Transcript_27897/g.61041 Transcript_27897/m.61041 type:complete len:272 (-) Transcript_27897:658-1473(-)